MNILFLKTVMPIFLTHICARIDTIYYNEHERIFVSLSVKTAYIINLKMRNKCYM